MPQKVVEVLVRIANALERIESFAQQHPAPRTPRKLSLLASAIAVAIDEGITSKAEIARRLGVHRSNLTRLPRLTPVLDHIRYHQSIK